MLFIDQIMTNIWKPVADLYQKTYQKAMELDANQLYEKLKNVQMASYQHEMNAMNNLVTSGCSHHIRKGKLSGCSMCNLHSVFHETEAEMEALRQKDKKLYAKVVKAGFENKRGIVETRSLREFVFSHNFLNDDEIPEDALEELFGKEGVFKKRPMIYEFETNAKSVTMDKLKILEGYVGRTGIWIRIGVECGNEWLRNHWLNKDITSNQIKAAIENCHEMGYRITGNVLMGIPGLTERQSQDVYIDTLKWLEEVGIDMYTCSVLNRKDTTIQGFIYDKLRDSKELADMGIVQGEHTGLPWLFSVVKSLSRAIEEIPEFGKKLTFGQFESDYIFGNHTMAYNGTRTCSCNKKIFDTLKSYAFNKDWRTIKELEAWIEKDPCFKEYEELVERQKRVVSLQETIGILGEEIAKVVWPDGWKEKYEVLKEELLTYPPVAEA